MKYGIADQAVGTASHAKNTDLCSCTEKNGCTYAPPSSSNGQEVMIMTSTTDLDEMELWHWDTFHVVISTDNIPETENNKVACKAHSHGKRYAFTVPLLDYANDPNITSQMEKVWIDSMTRKQILWYADHVVVDMTGPLGNADKLNQNVMDKTVELMTKVSNTGHLAKMIYCILPWSPPCLAGEDNCASTKRLLNQCQVIIMGPDSYLPDTNKECIAQANVPVGKFLLGIDQYINLARSLKIVAGIPWHGYKYSCHHLNRNTNKCFLTNGTGDCNYKSHRERMSLGQSQNAPYKEEDFKLDPLTQSICYNSNDMNDQFQIWTEDFNTLGMKYDLVKDLRLRGFAVWNAEDLKYGLTVEKLQFEKEMWGWKLHSILVSNIPKTGISRGHAYADTVAGVGVGCLLLGTALGVTFTCIAFRRCGTRRSHLNRPFKLDDDDDYRDDNGL